MSNRNMLRVSPPRRTRSMTPPDLEHNAHSAPSADQDDEKKVTWTYRPPVKQAVSAASVIAPATLALPKPVTTSCLPTYKILLCGDAAVGKSNLLTRFANNTFDIASRSTIGVEFVSREVELPTERDGSMERVNIQLWDTAGQERCNAISAAFFRGAKGIAVVYDCTRYPTLRNVPGWVAHAKQYADENCSFVVIRNKVDLANLQAVDETEGESIAHSLGLRHFCASALTGEGVPSAFLHLILTVNALVRSQQIASPKIAASRGRVDVGSGKRIPVDTSGFGSDSPSSQGHDRDRKCCR